MEPKKNIIKNGKYQKKLFKKHCKEMKFILANAGFKMASVKKWSNI